MIYEAKCTHCGRAQDYLSSVEKRNQTPICCEKPMMRILSLPAPRKRIDFVTDDITGEPVHITSSRQLERLCKQHNTTPKSSKPWY